jgi:hypothetical protein
VRTRMVIVRALTKLAAQTMVRMARLGLAHAVAHCVLVVVIDHDPAGALKQELWFADYDLSGEWFMPGRSARIASVARSEPKLPMHSQS